MSERPTCKTCAFWDRFSPDAAEEPLGECRVRGPVYNPAIMGFDHRHYGQQPVTEGDDWCGQHPDFPAYVANVTRKAVAP